MLYDLLNVMLLDTYLYVIYNEIKMHNSVS